MAIINQQQIQIIPSQNQLMVSGKGPLAVRLFMDFTSTNHFDLDLQNFQSLNQFDLCQSVYIDNADGGAAVVMTIPSSGFRFTAKSGFVGWVNVICPNPIIMGFDCAGGNPVTVFLCNVAIPGAAYSAI